MNYTTILMELQMLHRAPVEESILVKNQDRQDGGSRGNEKKEDENRKSREGEQQRNGGSR